MKTSKKRFNFSYNGNIDAINTIFNIRTKLQSSLSNGCGCIL